MKRTSGQVTGEALLIAAACAGIWYGGYYTVKGAKWVGHEVAKPFHKHKLPLAKKTSPAPQSAPPVYWIKGGDDTNQCTGCFALPKDLKTGPLPMDHTKSVR